MHAFRKRTLVGGSLAGMVLLVVFLGWEERWLSRGPVMAGHESLACEDCHRPAPGTFRQQMQANARRLVHGEGDFVWLGALPPDNAVCQGCHWRENDRHPVYRFLEPRFEKARREIRPQDCVSCHREHKGRRVTQEAGFCRVCHREFKLTDDPLQGTSHVRLAREERWDTCLGCHDFHGNHKFTPPKRLDRRLPQDALTAYLRGTGESPYGETIHKAKKPGEEKQ